jgi:hypothetical protein
MELQGSNRNPIAYESPIDREGSVNRKIIKREVDVLEDRLAKRRRFLRTPEGQRVRDLCDPMIKHENFILGLSMSQLYHRRYVTEMDVAAAMECWAEHRGRKSVWEEILYEPERIERRLAELQKNLGGDEEKT